MSSRNLNLRNAIEKINQKGALLVFPKANAKDPPSLWYEFFPRTPMRWEWDEGGDDRVARLWHLRAELSESNQVVYSKWYQGRATFFSKKVFTALIRHANPNLERAEGLDANARAILEALESNSPLSTKTLKKATDLRGKVFEAEYQRALKILFHRALIVGFGEIDDGAFPSLALAASRLIFEELWSAAEKMSPTQAQTILSQTFSPSPALAKFSLTKGAIQTKLKTK